MVTSVSSSAPRDAPAAAAEPSSTLGLGRLGGIGGLVFVALLVVQNIIRATAPPFTADPAAVVGYFTAHRAAALTPLVLFPFGMVAIVSFASSVVQRAWPDPRGRFWALMGGVAVAVLAALFALVNVLEIAIAVDTDGLAAAPQVTKALWTVHSAAFGLNLAAIALALVGLAQAARTAGLIPGVLAKITPIGALCLFVGAVCAVPLAEGSPVLYLSFVGFLVWAVFLVITGVRLLGGRAGSGPGLGPLPTSSITATQETPGHE